MKFISFNQYLQMNAVPQISIFVVSILAAVIVLTLHEFSHALIAVRCGDLTPKINGRLTLNPFNHFNYIGLALFAFTGFGWAEPVPINPHNFKYFRRGLAFTAIAGVSCNLLTALFICPFYMLTSNCLPLNWFTVQLNGLLWFIFNYSILFAVFNLLPLPPLDGWRFIDALARKRGRIFQFFQEYGSIILYFLIGYHFIVYLVAVYFDFQFATYLQYFDILEIVFTFFKNCISFPIIKIWELIF